ncbi:hypothetical protein [Flavitalea sp.]|nr:hypothetical protein [Flavitalea sp.]
MKNGTRPMGFYQIYRKAFVLAAAVFGAAVSPAGFMANAQIASKEHIYIHTDRNVYLAGETVFFKAYLYLQFAPSDLSSSLIYQLSDLSGNVRAAGLIPVTGGTAAGSIELGSGIPQGVYLLNTMTTKLSKPLPEEVYSRPLYIFNADNKEGSVKQPPSAPAGSELAATDISISASKSPKGRLVNVEFPDSTSTGKSWRIFGLMENQVVFAHQFILKTQTQSMQVPTLDLPDGILHFVLANEGGTILSKGLTSIDNGSSNLELTLNIDSFRTDSHGRNVFTLGFPAGIAGTFSVSVTDPGKDLNPRAKNIFTSLLKDSAIGHIEIDNSGEFVQKPKWLPDTNFISIKGKIDLPNSKVKIGKGDLIFFVQNRDSSSFTVTPEISKNGEVNLDKLFFEDTATISYGWSKSNRKMKIDFDLPKPGGQFKLWPTRLPFYEAGLFSDSSAMLVFGKMQKGLIEQLTDATMLDTVFVKGKTKSPKEIVNAKYTRGVFSNSNMAKVIDLINEPVKAGANILDYLQGKISGLNIVRLNNGYQLTSTRVSTMTDPYPHVNVYLDEQLSNQDFVRTLPVNDVALVKYFPPGNSGMLGMGNIGALAIYTKRPEDLTGKSVLKNENTFLYPGYTPVKPFQGAPSYGKKQNGYFSPTIYWNPSIYVAGEDNKAVISFINYGEVKQMKIVVEGFTEDGKIVSFEKIIP